MKQKNIVDPEIIKKITQMGWLGYKIDKIISILDIPANHIPDFKSQFQTKGSDIEKAYKKGIDQADFVIDSKLFELAKGGDLKALSKLESRQRLRK